jgi:hypothetical protein
MHFSVRWLQILLVYTSDTKKTKQHTQRTGRRWQLFAWVWGGGVNKGHTWHLMRISYILGIRLLTFVLHNVLFMCVYLLVFKYLHYLHLYTSGTYTAMVFGGCSSLLSLIELQVLIINLFTLENPQGDCKFTVFYHVLDLLRKTLSLPQGKMISGKLRITVPAVRWQWSTH